MFNNKTENNAVVYINSKKIECYITELTITRSLENSNWWENPISYRQDVDIKGILKSVENQEEDMDFRINVEEKSLSTKYKELDLDESTKKLRKYGLVCKDGTLTEKGKDFLLNILLEQHEDEVVEALKQVESSEEEKKS